MTLSYIQVSFHGCLAYRCDFAVTAMPLSLLLHPSICCTRASVLLAQCVRTLHSCAPKTLHSQAGHLLQRRFPPRFQVRKQSRKTRSQEEEWKKKNKTVLTYIAAAGVGMIGLSYAAVPLYRLYCQVRSHRHTFLLWVAVGKFYCCAFLPGIGAWWHGSGWTWYRSGGDDEACEGTHNQSDLQCRHACQHTVELQTTANGDLCKSSSSLLTWPFNPSRFYMIKFH